MQRKERTTTTIIGPPAVGKAALLRDITRLQAEVKSSGLMVIDSSNEITGDGRVPSRFGGEV